MSRPGFSIRATKASGKLSLADEDRYRALAKRLPDGEYDVVVEKHVHSRSAAQNRAYWLLIVSAISEHTGYEPDEVHELLKVRCNPKTVSIVNRESGAVEEQIIGGSTTGMNVEEFSAYYARCQKFAAEMLDCYCADPNEEQQFSAAPETLRRPA